MNLSDWPALMREGPEEMIGRIISVCDEVELENMPPKRYLRLHPDAVLAQKDRKALCTWSQEAAHELSQIDSVTQENPPNL